MKTEELQEIEYFETEASRRNFRFIAQDRYGIWMGFHYKPQQHQKKGVSWVGQEFENILGVCKHPILPWFETIKKIR